MTTTEPVTSAYASIRNEALMGLEREKLDPRADFDAVQRLVARIVDDYQSQAHSGNAPALRDRGDMVRRVVRSITGFGALSQLLENPTVEEIFIEGPHVTFIDGSGRLQVLTTPTTADENRQAINRLLADTDRHIDTANPIVQARVLNDSARLTAVIPPIADHVSATIRKYTMRKETLGHLVQLGGSRLSLGRCSNRCLGLGIRTTGRREDVAPFGGDGCRSRHPLRTLHRRSTRTSRAFEPT